MRPYILTESNWAYIKDASFDLAVLPWGATEAHNYHLPYGTDNIEADTIAAESARIAWERGARVIVLPVIPFGVNTGQADIKLDMNLNPSTQLAILRDVITVLNRQGIHKLLILNSHGGNDFRPLIRELGLAFPDMFLCMSNWYQSLDKKKYFENMGDHADEMETSLLLYLREDLVAPKDQWGDGAEKKNEISGFREGWAWAERKWSKISADTGVGNPVAATREKGEVYFKDVTQKVGQLMYDIATADTNNLYA
jgi:creatinine amidohydrolase